MNPERMPQRLPEGWRWARLADLCRVSHGGTPSKANPDFWTGAVPWVSPKDMKAPVLYDTTDHISEDAILQSSTTTVSESTVLVVVRSGILAHSLPVAIAGSRVAFNQDIKAVSPHKTGTIDPLFLFWSLKAAENRVIFDGVKKGPTVHSIRSGFLEDLEIPLPPLVEQKRIVAILNEQMAAVERARAAAEAQLEAAEVLPAAYLRVVFESPEAQRWPTGKLGEVLTLRKEVVHPRDNPAGSAIFVGLEHIEPSSGRRIGGLPVEMSQLKGRKPRFYRGDIVYGYLRPYLNKVWIADFDGLCSVDQYVYSVPAALADAQFIAWFMRSGTFLRRAPVDGAPAWLPRIRIDEVAATQINLPPLEEQHRIAAMLREQIASTEQARKAIQEKLGTINNLPAALLRLAFAGEL